MKHGGYTLKDDSQKTISDLMDYQEIQSYLLSHSQPLIQVPHICDGVLESILSMSSGGLDGKRLKAIHFKDRGVLPNTFPDVPYSSRVMGTIWSIYSVQQLSRICPQQPTYKQTQPHPPSLPLYKSTIYETTQHSFRL